jgi:hypothetical protein
LAIPFVLAGSKPGHVEVESGGIRHTIEVSTNHVLQRPQIDHRQERIVRKTGTLVRVTVDVACSKVVEAKSQFLQNLVLDYSLFNPHATFDFSIHGKRRVVKATASEWRKWLPTDPTSAHWYNQERLETLIGCYIAGESDSGKVRSVREFVSEFRGLSGTGKQKQVSEKAGLQRASLHDLASNSHFNHEAVALLLKAMQELSVPVKPEILGVLGKEHFVQRLKPQGETFRYICKRGVDERGLPVLIELALAQTPDGGLRGLHAGLNWSVPLGNPLESDAFRIDGERIVSGLSAFLANQRIDLEGDPVCLAVHLACPRFRYLDRGKGSISLGGEDE